LTTKIFDPDRNLSRSTRLLGKVGILCFIVGCPARIDPLEIEVKPKESAISLERVIAGPPVRKSLRWYTEQPGRVEAFEETPIDSKISGYVESIDCDLGDIVTRGQPLLRIRAPEYLDQVEQKRQLLALADAQIGQAQAAVSAAKAAVQATAAEVLQTEASLGRAEAELDRLKSESERIGQLASKGSVTAKVAEELNSQLSAAQAVRQEVLAAIETSKARKKEAEANVLAMEGKVDQANAQRKVSMADLQHAQTMFGYTQLTSPFDGIVTNRSVDTGQFVQPAGNGSPHPLLTIASVSRIRVFVQVPEQESGWVDAGYGNPDQGDKATVTFPSGPRSSIDARVTRTNRQLSSDSRSLTAEIDLDNQDLKILPGSFVTVRILLEERADVMTLPITAIVRNSERTYCCEVVDGRIQQRDIELGLRVADSVEVLSGLQGDESVVLIRPGQLEPAQPIEVIPPK
jgi:RND family efflux transporter MFP subunit